MKGRKDTVSLPQNKLIYRAVPDLKTIICHLRCLCRRVAPFVGLLVFLKDIFIISDETHLSLNKDFLSSLSDSLLM